MLAPDLEGIERHIKSLETTLAAVEALPVKWDVEQGQYSDTPEGEHAAAAVRCCAAELRKVLSGAG